MSLDILGWGKIADLATSILNRVVADPQAKLDAQMKLLEMEQQGEFKEIDAQLEMMKAQTDINLAEASNSSLFVSGWRPAIGWVCASALFYQYLFRPLAPWVFSLFHLPVDLPIALDDTLTQLVYGLLGMGLLRTVDKAIPHLTK